MWGEIVVTDEVGLGVEGRWLWCWLEVEALDDDGGDDDELFNSDQVSGRQSR